MSTDYICVFKMYRIKIEHNKVSIAFALSVA